MKERYSTFNFLTNKSSDNMKCNKTEALLKLNNTNMSDCIVFKIFLGNNYPTRKKDIFRFNKLIEAVLLTNIKLAFLDEKNNPVIIFNEKNKRYIIGI